MYGHPADMPALMEIAGRHGLAVVEDACLALGAAIAEQPVGSWGQVACFSFAPSKHLGACGGGGMAVTADAGLAERMRQFGSYGQPRENHYRSGARLNHLVEGLNERLDELQAALLRTRLPYLSAAIEGRREHAQAYTQGLEDTPIELPVERPDCLHSYRNYVIRVDQRDRLRQALRDAGIDTSQPYAPPLHLQPAYRRYRLAGGSFPVVEEAAERLLSVPIRPDLTEEQRGYVIEVLRRSSGLGRS